jgi:large subunit ribosomal protein L25
LELIELNANIRTTKGNGPARRLRREGWIPAVLYGPGSEPKLLSIETHALELLLKKNKVAQAVLNLTVNGIPGSKTAMIKELQKNCQTGGYLHADFYEVAMDRKVQVKVPVITTGKCIGVENGGMLQLVCRELEVLCFPNEIPKSIVLDVTDLDVGGSIHVEDIHLEGGVEIPADTNFTVLSVLGRMAGAAGGEGEEGGEGAGEAAEAK